MVQFHGITALLTLKCIILSCRLVEEHGGAGRVLLERFFSTFIFVPDSDACLWHIQKAVHGTENFLLSERLKNVTPVSAQRQRLRRGPISLSVLPKRGHLWQTHSKTPCFQMEADKLILKLRHSYVAVWVIKHGNNLARSSIDSLLFNPLNQDCFAKDWTLTQGRDDVFIK